MRRGFGRPLRRAFAADVPPLLRSANQMLSAGDYAGASSAFEQLARGLVTFLAGCDLTGFNIEHFDLPMLVREFKRAGID